MPFIIYKYIGLYSVLPLCHSVAIVSTYTLDGKLSPVQFISALDHPNDTNTGPLNDLGGTCGTSHDAAHHHQPSHPFIEFPPQFPLQCNFKIISSQKKAVLGDSRWGGGLIVELYLLPEVIY